jgi:excisionase family DNA binding protein
MALQRQRKPRPDAPQSVDQLLTIPQAAAKLGVSHAKFYRLMRDRQAGLPILRMPGRTTRIPAAKLQIWIEQHTEQAG